MDPGRDLDVPAPRRAGQVEQVGSRLSESGLREVVEKAQSHGLSLWDTAVVYGMGRSETVLARALKGYDRGEYQLSTKFTPQIAGAGGDPVADMLEQSLDRLGTDYVDLYWIHNPADVAGRRC
ncbi:aldo/keto reductase [Amycolatopsis sp. NPDC006131]|uniref:aldo/keto reductase n=1 Tax=Amycolatopsis sp. NPDC006131 TaxID=3156731 RepID=UPI0033A2A9F7